METQLHYDSNEQQLGLRFREKFITDFGIILKVWCLASETASRLCVTVALDIYQDDTALLAISNMLCLQARGLLNTVTGRVSGDAHLWQNVYTLQKQPQGRYQTPSRQQPSPLAVSIGSSYLTGSDEIVSWVRAKQQLRTPGSWRLKLRGKLEFPMKTQQVGSPTIPDSQHGIASEDPWNPVPRPVPHCRSSARVCKLTSHAVQHQAQCLDLELCGCRAVTQQVPCLKSSEALLCCSQRPVETSS